ncbi:uncharacterized protein TNCV_5075801 [Trichonephila clavipes]|uniref:Uncharacterized protein n=1 Tax=Trichonephila clavipes TaxID=2585209 RepID=A0A8X6S5Z9_TRICX|nr:uncharacterized protein TNCV_5075801 [Trichonephila clavipes]
MERVNCDLLQMIASFVNNNHETWDQFLKEFANALRRAVHATTGKTPAELFLSRKLITPFQKLVMVTDGAEFVVDNIEKLGKLGRKLEFNMKSGRSTTIGDTKLTLRTTVNVDQVRIYHQRKSDESVVDRDRSISKGSEYQSNSLEFSRPRLDRSQGFRSSKSSKKQVKKREKPSVADNKSGRREQWASKRKRTSGSNESSVGLRQRTYKKRTPEVRRFKGGVPLSLEENPDKKRRSPSSTSSNQQAKKRARRTKEKNGQVPAGGYRPGSAEERRLHSSRIQQGRSRNKGGI